jgi:hypothetical protein
MGGGIATVVSTVIADGTNYIVHVDTPIPQDTPRPTPTPLFIDITGGGIATVVAGTVGNGTGFVIHVDTPVPESTPLPTPTSLPFNISGSYITRPATGVIIFQIPMVQDITFPTDFAGSMIISETAATAISTFTILKNSVQIGAAEFPIGVTTSVITGTGASFVFGDVIKLKAPMVQDDTLSDIGINLIGTRE